MTRNIDIYKDLIRTLNLTKDETRIKKKAAEISNQIDSKIGNVTVLKNWSICKPIYSIQISCEILRIKFDRKNFIMLANTKEQDYYSSLSYIKKILGISSSITFDSLASRFGCPRIIPYVENMLEIFKKEWCKDLSAAGKRGINWNDDIYKVAVFWCCSKIVGGQGRINQEELISSPDFSTSHLEFQRTTKFVEKYCKSYINDLKSKIKKGELNIVFIKSYSSKRKNIEEENIKISKKIRETSDDESPKSTKTINGIR
ncbi:6730_t:CDS:2, partial [Diversispora eburnea]